MLEIAPQVRDARRMPPILIPEWEEEKEVADRLDARSLQCLRPAGPDAGKELDGCGGVERRHARIVRDSTQCGAPHVSRGDGARQARRST